MFMSVAKLRDDATRNCDGVGHVVDVFGVPGFGDIIARAVADEFKVLK
jgi:hypothetical protein